MHGAATTPRSHETVSDLGIDSSFLRRVHRTSIVLSSLFGASIAVYRDPLWAGGFCVAALWSVANLWSLERLIRAALRPSGRRLGAIVTAGVIKLPLLYAALVAVLVWGRFPALSLVAGLSVPLVVIVMKVVGRAVAPRIAIPSHRRHRPVDPT